MKCEWKTCKGQEMKKTRNDKGKTVSYTHYECPKCHRLATDAEQHHDFNLEDLDVWPGDWII